MFIHCLNLYSRLVILLSCSFIVLTSTSAGDTTVMFIHCLNLYCLLVILLSLFLHFPSLYCSLLMILLSLFMTLRVIIFHVTLNYTFAELNIGLFEAHEFMYFEF